MAHLHKHNLRLLKHYLRKTYTNDELISLSIQLPKGFGKTMCLSATDKPTAKALTPFNKSEGQSAADDYLDYLESQW